MDGDTRGYRNAEEQARELTRSIRREVNKLSEQWNALIERSDAWKRKLDDTATVSTPFFFFLLHAFSTYFKYFYAKKNILALKVHIDGTKEF